MWFWLSAIAILCWSGSDILSKAGSAPQDVNSHWKMVMSVGYIMGIHATVEVLRGTPFGLKDILIYLPVSFLYILAMVLGYIGLRYVVLSDSTPICNSSGAVAALLCFVFLHQSMSMIQFIAVLCISFGIFMLSVFEKQEDDKVREMSGIKVEDKYRNSFIALCFPIFYCISDGLGTFADAFVLDKYIPEGSANIAYEYTFLILAVLATIYVVGIKKEKIILKKETPKVLAGLCETVGQFAYIFAIGSNAIVSAPLISSYCIFSVLWARIFLKERLTKKQYAVIIIAVIGIVMLGGD